MSINSLVIDEPDQLREILGFNSIITLPFLKKTLFHPPVLKNTSHQYPPIFFSNHTSLELMSDGVQSYGAY